MVETQINPCTCMFTYPKGIRGFFFCRYTCAYGLSFFFLLKGKEGSSCNMHVDEKW